jgi:hypothetical protein
MGRHASSSEPGRRRPSGMERKYCTVPYVYAWLQFRQHSAEATTKLR